MQDEGLEKWKSKNDHTNYLVNNTALKISTLAQSLWITMISFRFLNPMISVHGICFFVGHYSVKLLHLFFLPTFSSLPGTAMELFQKPKWEQTERKKNPIIILPSITVASLKNRYYFTVRGISWDYNLSACKPSSEVLSNQWTLPVWAWSKDPQIWSTSSSNLQAQSSC